MAEALGKDEAWIKNEIKQYTKLAEQYLLKEN
jgi:hypothetical protein